MILSGKEIKNRLGKDIVIEPFDEKQLNPNSYNVRLHNELLVYKNDALDMKIDNPIERLIIPEEGLMLAPGQLYLGRTLEYTETDNLVPKLDGRSSMGRLGLSIHVTAGFGDVGFKGYWTLEMWVIKPVKIYPYVEIGQLEYQTILGDYTNYDGGKYQANAGIQSSKIWKEF